VLVNNSTNINKTKESVNSDGQQYHQYIGGIVDQHCLHFLCVIDIGGIVDHHCLHFLCFVDQQNKESVNSAGQQFNQYQQNKESVISDGQQFHQYQQNELKSLNTIKDHSI
jgi:hypothetical protein